MLATSLTSTSLAGSGTGKKPGVGQNQGGEPAVGMDKRSGADLNTDIDLEIAMNIRRSICATLAAAALTLASAGCAETGQGSAVPQPGSPTTNAPATTTPAMSTQPAATEEATTSAPTSEAATEAASVKTVIGDKESDVLQVDKVKLSIIDVRWGGESPDSLFNIEVCSLGEATTMGQWTYDEDGRVEQPWQYDGPEKALPLSGPIEAGQCVSGWVAFANGPTDLTYTAPSGDVAVWRTQGW